MHSEHANTGKHELMLMSMLAHLGKISSCLQAGLCLWFLPAKFAYDYQNIEYVSTTENFLVTAICIKVPFYGTCKPLFSSF